MASLMVDLPPAICYISNKLTPYKDVPSGDLSGGNKRKLALGMALIGDHKYTLLDEPTSGVDPISRRKIWTVIDAWKTNKKASFVLTSHSMDECEALCDDIAIMKKGKINVNGTILDLKKKYNTGFSLKVKLKAALPNALDDDGVERRGKISGISSNNSLPQLNLQIQTNLLDSIVKNTFSIDNADVRLMDHNDRILRYHIKNKTNWSEVFENIEKLKQVHSNIIEDYTLSGTSLEDVFLPVARAPENEQEADPSEANGRHTCNSVMRIFQALLSSVMISILIYGVLPVHKISRPNSTNK